MKSSVVLYVEYKEIKDNIKRIIKEKKITKDKIINRAKPFSRSINRYYNNEVLVFNKDALTKLCYILDCSIDELLNYKK